MNKDSLKSHRRVIYQCREVSLSEVPGGYAVTVEGVRERFFENVLEAWSNFIDVLDTRVRRRIAKMQQENLSESAENEKSDFLSGVEKQHG